MQAASSFPRHLVAATTRAIDRVDDPGWHQAALDSLTTVERARFDRFRHEDDRWMFAMGRLLARDMVGHAVGCAPRALQWREGAHGRPEIAAPVTDVHFNLAHSAGVVACAVGRGRELGVDLENLYRRPPDPAIVERYLSPREAADVRGHGSNWVERFLIYWTLKEAYLKARGVGISVQLADITFAFDESGDARIAFSGSLSGTDDRWRFLWARIAPHHLIALAASARDEDGPVSFDLDAVLL